MTRSEDRKLIESQSYPDTGESGEAYEVEVEGIQSFEAIRLFVFRIKSGHAVTEDSESGETYEAEVRWSHEEETLNPIPDDSEPLEL